MRHLLVLLSVFLFISGCAYHYLDERHMKKYRRNQSSAKQKQVEQLRVLDTAIFSRGAGVYIRPIMVNRSGTGIYGYNRNSSHFGRVHFFEFSNDSVICIPRSNEDSLRAEVERFLREKHFTSRKIRRALQRVSSTYKILSTDSF